MGGDEKAKTKKPKLTDEEKAAKKAKKARKAAKLAAMERAPTGEISGDATKNKRKRESIDGDDAAASKTKVKQEKTEKKKKKKKKDNKTPKPSAREEREQILKAAQEKRLASMSAEDKAELEAAGFADAPAKLVEEQKLAIVPDAEAGKRLANNPHGLRELFCGNLSFKVTDEDVQAFFGECGEMASLRYITDKETGQFYGTAFVEFVTAEGASKAMERNGQELLGRDIKLEFSKPRPQKKMSVGSSAIRPKTELSPRPPGGINTAFLGNLSYDVNDELITEWVKDCGDVKQIRWLIEKGTERFKGCGFIEFFTVEAVDELVKRNGDEFMGRTVRIDFGSHGK